MKHRICFRVCACYVITITPAMMNTNYYSGINNNNVLCFPGDSDELHFLCFAQGRVGRVLALAGTNIT